MGTNTPTLSRKGKQGCDMNDFSDIVVGLGRGIVKILISGLVGVGVGMLVIGIVTAGRPQIWEMRQVPGEMFIGIGAGLLSGGAMLLLLFLVPWLFKRAPERSIHDDLPVATRAVSSSPRPEEAPQRSERPADADFYSK